MSHSRRVRSDDYTKMDAEGLSFTEQSLYRYLETGPLAHYSNIFLAPVKTLCGATEWDRETVELAMARLAEVGRIDWDAATGVVRLLKGERQLTSDKQVKGAMAHVKALPDSHVVSTLLRELDQISIDTKPESIDSLPAKAGDSDLTCSDTDTELKKKEKKPKKAKPATVDDIEAWTPSDADRAEAAKLGVDCDAAATAWKRSLIARENPRAYIRLSQAFRNHLGYPETRKNYPATAGPNRPPEYRAERPRPGGEQ